MKIEAAVARHASAAPFVVEHVDLATLQADELLVRIVGAGICHTDLSVIDGLIPLALPMVLGHEGAGVVEQIGPSVRDIEVGDPVVLTFMTCGHCPPCTDGHPAYCDSYAPLNFGAGRPDGSSTIHGADGERIGSVFFSQSSFATYAIARQRNAIKVRRDAPIEYLGPLACGLSTGAGTVMNVLKPGHDSKLAVFGVGAVGVAAIMAAKAVGVEEIIAVDRVGARLEIARALGATVAIDTSQDDLAGVLQGLGGIDHAIDTSGVPAVIEAAVGALKTCGTCILLGASHDKEIRLNVLAMISGKSVKGVVNGDCNPADLIPKLVDMYLAGTFPLDRISTFYPLEEINQAVADAKSGKTIKPIIRFKDEARRGGEGPKP